MTRLLSIVAFLAPTSVLFWSPDGETLECSTLAKTGELTVTAQNELDLGRVATSATVVLNVRPVSHLDFGIGRLNADFKGAVA